MAAMATTVVGCNNTSVASLMCEYVEFTAAHTITVKRRPVFESLEAEHPPCPCSSDPDPLSAATVPAPTPAPPVPPAPQAAVPSIGIGDDQRSSASTTAFDSTSKASAPAPIFPQLQPDQVLIRSHCSAISAGTELKVYSGSFECAVAADTTIAALAGGLQFPLQYGYSLVGTIIGVGSCGCSKLVGQRVFVFHPHASYCVVNTNDIMLIPDDIDFEDAVFLPSVETAVSLVHDAAPRLDEKVAIFGQGIIGLLVAAILARSPSYVQLAVYDPLPNRTALTRQLSPHIAINPSCSSSCSSTASASSSSSLGSPDYDVVVEVSGNGRALQQAIDVLKPTGKLVLGSWYGTQPVPLVLGTKFHRSHCVLVASQVSVLPAELRDRWTKSRRMATAWKFVQLLRPATSGMLVTGQQTRDSDLTWSGNKATALNSWKNETVATSPASTGTTTRSDSSGCTALSHVCVSAAAEIYHALYTKPQQYLQVLLLYHHDSDGYKSTTTTTTACDTTLTQ